MATTHSHTFTGPAGDAARWTDEHRRTGVGHAHGKAIVLGEHAVVYGAPALAVPLPQLTVTARATWREPDGGAEGVILTPGGPDSPPQASYAGGLRDLVAHFKEWAGVVGDLGADIRIDCAVPQGRGLGSSAACARAVVLALADLVGRRPDAGTVFDLVQVSEKVTHGRSSGIDAVATGATAPLLFRSGSVQELSVPPPDRGSPQVRERTGGPARTGRPSGDEALFVVADSGVSGSTKEAVELLRRGFERDPGTREAFVGRVSELTEAAVRDLADGRWRDFGARLTENHRLLRECGISTDRIDALVEVALGAGGLGAKISGGGLGGCVIVLAGGPDRAKAIVGGLREAGAVRSWIVPVGRCAPHAN